MADTELLDAEQRKAKVSAFIKNLDARANEILWNNPGKLVQMKRYHPELIEEFWKRWDELDARAKEYIDGAIEFSGDSMQMDLIPGTNRSDAPRLVVDRDVENFGRDLFCWLALQVKDQ